MKNCNGDPTKLRKLIENIPNHYQVSFYFTFDYLYRHFMLLFYRVITLIVQKFPPVDMQSINQGRLILPILKLAGPYSLH